MMSLGTYIFFFPFLKHSLDSLSSPAACNTHSAFPLCLAWLVLKEDVGLWENAKGEIHLSL